MKTELRVAAGLTLGVLGLWCPSGVGAAVSARPTVSAASAGAGERERQRPAAKASRAALSAQSLEKLQDVLAGADPEAVAAAARALADSAASNAALPLVELLAVGTSPSTAVVAIEALGKLRDPASVDVLALYACHRSADVRRAAVTALGGFADARVVSTLLERLGDSAPAVRAAAAEGLATRNEKAAVPRLLALLKRNDAGAAAPLGALAPVSAIPGIAELQGSIDDDTLASTLGELVKRHDVPESVRIDIVKTLAGVPGAASTTALVEYAGALPASDRRASKTEALKIVDQRSKQP